MTYSSEVLADSPLGYWRLGDASGAMTDSSGNGRNGTYNGSPTLGSTGLIPGDTAVTLNGTSQYGLVASASWMNVASFSVDALYKPSSVTGSRTVIARRSLISINATTTMFGLRLGGNNAEIFIRIGTVTTSLISSRNLVIGTEYYIGATYDNATGLLCLYVNDELDSSVVVTPGTLGGAAADLQIGRGFASGEFAAGVLDEVAFYGTALSSARMIAHAQAKFTTHPDGRVSREHVEVLHAIVPDSRVSRLNAEVLHEVIPNFRVHTLRPEVLIRPDPPDERVHALRAEVLIDYWTFPGVRVTEVDAARPGARNYVGVRVIEVDEARPTTGEIQVPGVRVTEADNARSGSVHVEVAGVRTTESDAARPGTVVDIVVAGVRVTEAEAARAGGLRIEGVRVTEADSARAGVVAVDVAGVRVTEADSVRPASSNAVIGVRVTEADTARPGVWNVAVAGVRVTETDVARAGKIRIVGVRVTEVNVARAGEVTGDTTFHGVRVIEVDTIFVLNRHVGTIRWIFYDPATSETWTVPINPSSMTPIVKRRELTHSGSIFGTLSMQTGRREESFDFTGVIRSQAHYDQLVLWAAKRNAIEITDHVGRRFRVYITDFEPTDRSPIPRAPKRWRYVMKSKLLAGPL